MKDYIIKNIDPKLWHKVKILVAKKGITIKDLIISFLKSETKNI